MIQARSAEGLETFREPTTTVKLDQAPSTNRSRETKLGRTGPECWESLRRVNVYLVDSKRPRKKHIVATGAQSCQHRPGKIVMAA